MTKLESGNVLALLISSGVLGLWGIGGALLLPGAADDDLCDFHGRQHKTRRYSHAETDIFLVSLTLHVNDDAGHTVYIT